MTEKKAALKRITTCAHCLDEIEDILMPEYGVRIVDRANEPWEVTFEGPEEGLRRMCAAHWGPGEFPEPDDLPLGPPRCPR